MITVSYSYIVSMNFSSVILAQENTMLRTSFLIRRQSYRKSGLSDNNNNVEIRELFLKYLEFWDFQGLCYGSNVANCVGYMYLTFSIQWPWSPMIE